MGTPDGPDTVAWYQRGPRPGEIGSAVVAGHFGTWEDGRGSVFDNLHQLKAGDRVFVQDEAGERISFVVRESRRFDPEADATDVFTSDDGKAHLNLITCEGDWSESAQSYSRRLVVFTDRE
jgi:LPXTG-site transpeptidase (sortase) family protein